MKDHDLVKQGGAWYTLVDQNGNDLKFLSKDWTEKLKDVELKKHVYDLICEKVILKYQSSKLGIDDVVETNRVVDD